MSKLAHVLIIHHHSCLHISKRLLRFVAKTPTHLPRNFKTYILVSVLWLRLLLAMETRIIGNQSLTKYDPITKVLQTIQATLFWKD